MVDMEYWQFRGGGRSLDDDGRIGVAIAVGDVGRRVGNERVDWVRIGRSIWREERCDCCSSLAVVAVREDMVV